MRGGAGGLFLSLYPVWENAGVNKYKPVLSFYYRCTVHCSTVQYSTVQ